ncbi:MAG TPA: response regulator transcription factor [Terriglobia bacterium]|nr:response regulator transcription factor [Terriglobia bacterium]
MKPQRKIRLLIADDHPVVREGLVSILNRDKGMDVVATAADGQTAVEEFRRCKPDVIMVDLRMPVMDGVQATQEILKINPHAHVIILTTYDDNEDIYRTLSAGAKAYLLKDVPRDVLLNSIRAVYRGETIVGPRITAKLVTRIHHPELSSRELDVLRAMAKGLANKEIGAALGITEGTVKSHVNHVLKKLGTDNRTAATQVAYERGLLIHEQMSRFPLNAK